MNATLEKIVSQTRDLSNSDKAELAQILIADLDPWPDEDVKAAWAEEAERRYSAHLRGEMESFPADEVFARVRELIRK